MIYRLKGQRDGGDSESSQVYTLRPHHMRTAKECGVSEVRP